MQANVETWCSSNARRWGNADTASWLGAFQKMFRLILKWKLRNENVISTGYFKKKGRRKGKDRKTMSKQGSFSCFPIFPHLVLAAVCAIKHRAAPACMKRIRIRSLPVAFHVWRAAGQRKVASEFVELSSRSAIGVRERGIYIRQCCYHSIWSAELHT